MKRIDFLEKFENELCYSFFNKLEEYKSSLFDGDYDYKSVSYTFTKQEFKETFGFIPVTCSYYSSSHCGCEHDCCGCVSSVTTNFYVHSDVIFITVCTSFNY